MSHGINCKDIASCGRILSSVLVKPSLSHLADQQHYTEPLADHDCYSNTSYFEFLGFKAHIIEALLIALRSLISTGRKTAWIVSFCRVGHRSNTAFLVRIISTFRWFVSYPHPLLKRRKRKCFVFCTFLWCDCLRFLFIFIFCTIWCWFLPRRLQFYFNEYERTYEKL